MASNIIVTTAVDVYSTINSATRVLMFSDGDSDTGQGGNELTIQARQGDQISWFSSSTLPGWNVVLTQFKVLSGGAVIGASDGDVLQPNANGVYQATIQNKGTLTYTFTFYVYNPRGDKKGPYTWDPYVTVK